MFLGIDRDAWISLWSGALGAIPAAILAALVAVSVLKRSNRKQQELVDLQLKEQGKGAALAREKSAMADLIGATNRFAPFTFGHDPLVVNELTSSFIVAVFRWELEHGERGGQGDALLRCASVLASASILAMEEDKEQVKQGFVPSPKENVDWSDMENIDWSDALIIMVGELTKFGVLWYAQPSARMRLMENLIVVAERLQKRVDAYVHGQAESPTTT